MMSWATARGLLRSLWMYYAKPGRKRQLMAFYGQFIQPGELCFDIGSHVGDRLWAWSGLGARIIALEPQPACMALLRRLYGHRPTITLLAQAVGASPGSAVLHISPRTPTVTSLSTDWIGAVQRDAGFAWVRWEERVEVPVTTLDALINTHGEPVFCKIDVEGFEPAVLAGLSRPLALLSFEYIPAALDQAHDCIGRLETLGDYRYNWSPGEDLQLQEDPWLTAEALLARLAAITADGRSGDIYARLL